MIPEKNIMVSIIMLTYRHENFLKQAVEAVLNQKTNFDFELIVANDNSPDNTNTIMLEIIEQYPEANIVYFKNDTNIGIMPNSKKALDLAKGKYLALCEGDDYWTTEHKLQRQVEFLEQNPDFAICFHNTRIEFFERDDTPYLLNENLERDVFTLDDLIGEDEIWFMATASVMIRHAAYGKTPDWLVKSKSGDIPMLILAARYGKIKYLPDVMAVYRKHSLGTSLTDHKDDEAFLRNRIYMYDKLKNATDKKYNTLFERNIARYYFMLLSAKQFRGKYLKGLPVVLKYVKLTYPRVPKLKELIRDHIIPPFFLLIFRSIKGLLGVLPEKTN